MPRIQRDTCNFSTSVYTSCALIMHQTKCLLLTIWRCKNINKHKVVSLELLASGFLYVLQKRHYHVLLVILMRSSPPLMKEIVCLDVFCWIRTLSCVAVFICSPGPLHQWPVYLYRKGRNADVCTEMHYGLLLLWAFTSLWKLCCLSVLLHIIFTYTSVPKLRSWSALSRQMIFKMQDLWYGYIRNHLEL